MNTLSVKRAGGIGYAAGKLLLRGSLASPHYLHCSDIQIYGVLH